MKRINYFKYRSSENLDRDLKIISDCEIYYSNPEQFNDPFDCAPTTVAFTLKQKRLLVKNLLESENKDIPQEWKDTLRQALSDDELLSQMTDRITTPEYLLKRMSSYGVLALSKEIDNLLLWAHYSSSHTGFAIEFDITDVVSAHTPGLESYPLDYFESNLMAKPLEYSNIRPPSISPNRLFAEPFFHKSNIWSYENEYRIVSNFGSGLKKFKYELLSGVYLGCKISSVDKSKVIDVVKTFNSTKNASVKIFQSRKDNINFELHFDELSTS